MNRKYLNSYAYLSKASFSQNFDEHKVMQVHPLDFRSDVTFDRSILSASFALHSNTASVTTSSSTSIGVPRYGSNRRGGGDGVFFVLLSMVVERQNLPNALQLLRIWIEMKISWCVCSFALVPCRLEFMCGGQNFCYPGHMVRWGQTLSNRLLP